ncbi:transmembrane protein [Perilla frutescens var. frutescens]|nr:transmembrane protein [Perilla frutescens var. frutescens]
MKSPAKILTQFPKRALDLDWRLLLLILFSATFLTYLSLSSSAATVFLSLPKLAPLKSIFRGHATPNDRPVQAQARPLNGSRIAVCLVGGARRFELTGPSIVERLLRVYENSDLFLHCPLDSNAYKLQLLNDSPRIASVRIFKPQLINETESQTRVLTASNSPNGIQGLLQYFSLVEGCLTMIKAYQERNNFTYDWIIRTRVDGYWSDPLGPENFIPGKYLVPPGSSYGGLNDRFGVGDYNTSVAALSRLSLIPKLDAVGLTQLNSEMAFKAQLSTQNVQYTTKRLPFCVVTDRKYGYPPARSGVPVTALSSRGPLSGAKCRPCKPVCSGPCVGPIMSGLFKTWSWTEWANNTLELCDAHGEWENGWEKSFDDVAGEKLASARKKVWALNVDQCVDGFEKFKNRSAHWSGPTSAEICGLGLKRPT